MSAVSAAYEVAALLAMVAIVVTVWGSIRRGRVGFLFGLVALAAVCEMAIFLPNAVAIATQAPDATGTQVGTVAGTLIGLGVFIAACYLALRRR
jgi:hypothetical protein